MRYFKNIVLTMAIVTMGIASTASAVLTIPNEIQPENLANTTLTTMAPYITVLIGVGLVLTVAIAVYRLVVRKGARFGR